MKKIRNLATTALALFSVVFTQSCSEKEVEKTTVEPVFPETVVEKTITEGNELTEFEVSPNMAWKIEVTGEGAGTAFWIDDNGIKEVSISGKNAETVKFSVVFSTEKEFDVNRACEVRMSMGGQTKVIGKLVKPAMERTLTFSVAKVDEFLFKAEYEAAENVSLVTFDNYDKYLRPVKILANYDWALTLPEWCQAEVDGEIFDGSITGEANREVMFTVVAVLADEIAGGTSASMKVRDGNNSSEFVEIPVVLPAFNDRYEFDAPNYTDFDAEGNVDRMYLPGTEPEKIIYVNGYMYEEAVVKILPFEEKTGFYGTAFAEWLMCKLSPDTASGAGVFNHYVLEFSAEPFAEEGVRRADVLVLPKSMDKAGIDEFLTPEGNALKEEYRKYLLASFNQTGMLGDFVTPESTPEAMAEVKCYFKPDHSSWIAGTLNTKQVFELTYGETWSEDEAALIFSQPVSHFKVYDAEVGEITDTDNFWVSLNLFANNTKGRVSMFPDNCTTELKEAFIALYTSAEEIAPAAVIYCKFSKDAVIPSGDKVTIGQGTGSIRRMAAEEEMYMALTNEFSVTDIFEVKTSDKSSSLKFDGEFWNVLLCKAIPPFDQMTQGDLSLEAVSASEVYVYVADQLEKKGEAVIVFADNTGINAAAVHFIYDPQASGNAGAPFTFAYPDQVSGATLAPYAGNMDEIAGNFYGVKPENVYQLTYEQEWPVMSMITVPGEPVSLEGWNCSKGPAEGIWLKAEVIATNQLSVEMNQVGKTDYLVWKAADGYKYILVCTRTK